MMNKRVESFSSGEKNLITLAKVLLRSHRLQIITLDEITSQMNDTEGNFDFEIVNHK